VVYALLIDDDKALQESLQRTASLAGLDLLTASTWDEGLTLFHVHSPDLVVVDYNLPGSRHGLRLIAEVRNLRPSVRLILLSAYLDDADVAEIEALGLVDRAISKVTDPGAIDAVLDEIKAASERAGRPTNWVDVAVAHQRAETVSSTALDELDRRLRRRRGIA
jgi:ActR/RegA family two-component response regulator